MPLRRSALCALALLTACDLYFPSRSPPASPPFEAGDPQPECSQPQPAGDCTCTSTIGWACTTCAFGEGSGPVSCDHPGATCQIETWEHGCSCACDSDGWWHCSGETIGSTSCTSGPPDAGIPYPTCGVIEAESAAAYPGWAVSPLPAAHGGAELSADVVNATFALPFRGTGVVMYYEAGPTRGTIAVTIDGGTEVDVDALAPGEFTWGNAATIATGLAPGVHTATIRCATLDCDVDYIDVTCAAM